MAEKKRRFTHTCKRCGGTWRGYRRKPARCGIRGCASLYWDKPRETEKIEVGVKPEVTSLLDSLRLTGGKTEGDTANA